ncbi:ATP-dependent helicase [Chloroflexales bacterium ZM16-3]|nr:ATP-dependent helicase [Chloroflexales bacterium ZM16-3]
MTQLTDQQRQIVDHDHGPAMVFAVAGAGKTTAMVHRVERLVREGVFAPQRILVSSFNKAAVDDIGRAMERWPHCRSVARYTLHALGFKIVRSAAQGGWMPRLAEGALKTGGEERQILWAARDLARKRGLVASDELDGMDEQDLLNYIGVCKGNLRYPELAVAGLPPEARKVAGLAEAPPDLPWYLDMYALHEEVRQERGWITFDDMLLLGWELLVRHPELRARWQASYDALLVDEFQDVNLAQSEILDMLAASHGNYMAIGDDDQTIYGFRGARMAFFRGFAQRYGANVYEMTDNFRCRAGQIVLANRVIAQNRERHPKALVTTRGFGGATLLREAKDEAAMASQLAEDVAAARAAGHSYAQIAVLVRLNAQTPVLEQALIAAHIPYQLAGDEPFFRRREIADLLKYAELAGYDAALRAGRRLSAEDGERLTLCWRSVYNRPKRYLTRQLFQEVADAVLRQGQPLSTSLTRMGEKVSERTNAALGDLAALLVWLSEAQLRLPADRMLADLDNRLGYQGFLMEHSGFPETGAGYAANVASFIQYARGKGTLAELRGHLAQLEAERAEVGPRADAVDIRTIHRAKGLEWSVVLVPHCNAGYIPFSGADDMEEERRLLYVAVTRAREWLRLYAVAGGETRPSPFLAAIGAEGVLRRVAELEGLLAGDPAAWTASQALSVATFPREFGQERFVRLWWRDSAEQRGRAAGRVVALIDAVQRRGAGERVGISAAEIELWGPLAYRATELSDAPFVGIEDLCALSPVGGKQLAGGRRAGKAVSEPPPYSLGEQVAHPHFGRGTVVAVEEAKVGRKTEWYLTVRFGGRGQVKLLAGVAPLTRA